MTRRLSDDIDDEDEESLDSEAPDPSDWDDDDQPDLVPCPHCRRFITEDAERCHHCGELVDEQLLIPKWVWITAAALVLLFVVMVALHGF